MKKNFFKKLKLRLWHFLYMPPNVSNIISGKNDLANLVERLKDRSSYYLVYQYGKSGSSTVYDYFLRSGFCAIHCHNLNDKTLKIKEFLAIHPQMPKIVSGQRFFSNARYRVYQRFLLGNTDKDINIFVSLRKPEGFLLSVYFQQWKLFSSLVNTKYNALSVENFTEYFNESMSEIDGAIHQSISQRDIEELVLSDTLSFGTRNVLHLIYGYMFWFESELFDTFDLNESHLIEKQGFWHFQKKNIKGSIIRVEDFNQSLNDSLNVLLGTTVEIPIVDKNVAKSKPNFEYYEHLKQKAKIPDSVLGLMENSFSYRFFYNDHK